MNRILIIPFCIASIITVFFSILWGWVILAVPTIFLVSRLFWLRHQNKKIPPIPDLSDEANKLFRKYGFFYSFPFFAKDYVTCAGMVSVTAMVLGIIGFFKGFFDGALITIGTIFLMSYVGRGFDPTIVMKKPEKRRAHAEIVAWNMEKSEREKGYDKNHINH